MTVQIPKTPYFKLNLVMEYLCISLADVGSCDRVWTNHSQRMGSTDWLRPPPPLCLSTGSGVHAAVLEDPGLRVRGGGGGEGNFP